MGISNSFCSLLDYVFSKYVLKVVLYWLRRAGCVGRLNFPDAPRRRPEKQETETESDDEESVWGTASDE